MGTLKSYSAILVSAALLAIGVNLSPAAEPNRTALRIQGSKSASSLVDSWGKRFTSSRADTTIVVTGVRSDKAFTALAEGLVEIAFANRKMTSREIASSRKAGIDPVELLVSRDGLAVVTSASNPLEEITLDELSGVFSGDYTDWAQIEAKPGAITVFTGEFPLQEATVFFWENVLNQMPFRSDAKTRLYSKNLIQDVSKTPGSIGFVTLSALNAFLLRNKGSKVKTLRVKKNDETTGVEPSIETCSDGSYPISMPLIFYWDKRRMGKKTEEFATYCRTQGMKAAIQKATVKGPR